MIDEEHCGWGCRFFLLSRFKSLTQPEQLLLRLEVCSKPPPFSVLSFQGAASTERILKFRRYIYHDLSESSAGDHSHCLLRESYVKLPVAIESVKPATEFLLGQ